MYKFHFFNGVLIHANPPFTYLVEYNWDVSKSNDKSVNAKMHWADNGFIIKITGTGKMIDFDSSSNNAIAWFKLHNMSTGWMFKLSEVSIGEGITYIGRYSFIDSPALCTVKIPLSMQRIGDYAFMNCVSLKQINYSGTTEQWKHIICDKNWMIGSSLETIICSDGLIKINN